MIRDTGEDHHKSTDMHIALEKCGYIYEVMDVPNIVNITYGRDVGYKIEQESFTKDIEDISATEIRNKVDPWFKVK